MGAKGCLRLSGAGRGTSVLLKEGPTLMSVLYISHAFGNIVLPEIPRSLMKTRMFGVTPCMTAVHTESLVKN